MVGGLGVEAQPDDERQRVRKAREREFPAGSRPLPAPNPASAFRRCSASDSSIVVSVSHGPKHTKVAGTLAAKVPATFSEQLRHEDPTERRRNPNWRSGV